jgi:prevent-host-death family protein
MYNILYIGGVKMTIINATTARNNFFKLMEEAIANNEPIIVTGKSGNVVVLSEADFRAMEETLYLCSIPTMREKIMKGLDTPLDECLEDEDE